MPEQEIGTVTHWFGNINVAVVKLSGALRVGDKIIIRRGGSEAEDEVLSMQVDHVDRDAGSAGEEVAIKINGTAKEGAHIYKAE